MSYIRAQIGSAEGLRETVRKLPAFFLTPVIGNDTALELGRLKPGDRALDGLHHLGTGLRYLHQHLHDIDGPGPESEGTSTRASLGRLRYFFIMLGAPDGEVFR